MTKPFRCPTRRSIAAGSPGTRRSEEGADGLLAALEACVARDTLRRRPAFTGQISDAVSISERPPVVEDRALPGHWEGDLLFGSSNSQIATLVERQSRYVMLAKIGKKDTETAVNALIKHAHKLPHELHQSLTWDRGKEMADHRRFTLATDIKVYFCDPRSPWQRIERECEWAIEAVSTQGN